MPSRTETAARGRTIGSLLAAGAVGVLVLSGVSACASSTKTAASSDTSSVPIVTSSGSPSPATGTSGGASTGAASGSASASASAGATGSNHPMIPGPGGIVVTPQAQVPTAPGGKLTPFDSAAHSADGRTIYLGLESQGGACGQYEVVLQQTSTTVSAGLSHLSSGGHVCPMYVAHMLIQVKLSAPLDGRRVIDLANGQVVSSPQVA